MPVTLQAVCPEMASPFPIFPHLFAAHGHKPTKAFHDSGSLSEPNAPKRSVHPPSDRDARRLLPPGICSHLRLAASMFLPAATPVLPLSSFLWDGVSSPYQGTTSTQFLQALIKPENLVQPEEEHLFGSALVTPSKPEVALLWYTVTINPIFI